MAMILSSVILEVDDDIVGYKPNSLKFTDGDGELVAYSVSKGNGKVDVVFGINDETKIGKISFELYGTAANIAKKRSWSQKRKTGGVAIRLSDSVSGFTRTFKTMNLSNDGELTISQESSVSCEFQGSQAV